MGAALGAAARRDGARGGDRRPGSSSASSSRWAAAMPTLLVAVRAVIIIGATLAALIWADARRPDCRSRAEPAAPGPAPSMADIFISYSRRDQQFVERLRESLAERTRTSGSTARTSGPAVEWRREIELGIEGSDIFAFVISPGRAALRGLRPRAGLCGGEEEADRAPASPGARRRPGPRRPQQPQLRHVPHRRGVRAGLRRAAGRDRRPARVGARAHPACSSGPRNGSMAAARAARCSAAPICARPRRGLAEQAAHKEPQPTPLQAEYILASRTAATRRQWIGAAAAVAAGVAIVAVAIFAVLQRRDAQRDREQQARIAQSRQPRRGRRPAATDRPRAEHPARRARRFGEPDGRGRAARCAARCGSRMSS